MIYSGKRTETGEMKLIKSETLDSTPSSFFYENAFAFNVADSPSFAALSLVGGSVSTCQYAHLRMHTSTASFIILQHVVEYSIGCRRSTRSSRGARMRAAQRDERIGTPYCTRVARCAETRFSTLEHASPVLGSGKGGQTGDQGIVTPRRGRGRSGARGEGH